MALPRVDIENKSSGNRTDDHTSSLSANQAPPSPIAKHSRSKPQFSPRSSRPHSQHHASLRQDPNVSYLYYQQPPAGQRIPINLHNKDCGTGYKGSPKITKECVWLWWKFIDILKPQKLCSYFVLCIIIE